MKQPRLLIIGGTRGLGRELVDVVARRLPDRRSARSQVRYWAFVAGQDVVVDSGVSLQWPKSLARDLLDIRSAPTHEPTHKRTK